MNKIFAPFLPPWAETGLQPAFYDVESGTVLQQTARMYDKVNQLIRLFNELSEETQTTVAEYVAKFVELKDFVDDYFDNLDVQEEINNKLDEMAEQGQLADIISQYLNSTAIFGYDTVADMKASDNLTNGSFARTLGYYDKNDGNGGLYKIVTRNVSDTEDDYNIFLSDTLVAKLVRNNQYVENITCEEHVYEPTNTKYYITHIPTNDEYGNRLRLKLGLADDKKVETGYLETARSFAERHKATICINAGVADNSSSEMTGQKYGMVMVDGQLISNTPSSWWQAHWALGITTDGTLVSFGPVQTESEARELDCVDVVSGFTPLMVNGVSQKFQIQVTANWYTMTPTTDVTPEADKTYYTANLTAPYYTAHSNLQSFTPDVTYYEITNEVDNQQIIGQNTTTKEIYILTANGRDQAHDIGMTKDACIQILQELGCDFAYQLDAGGSAMCVYHNTLMNNPLYADGEQKERPSATFLYVSYENDNPYSDELNNINTRLSNANRENVLSKTYDLKRGYKIPNGTDLNSFVWEGVYHTDNADNSESLLNIPVISDYVQYTDQRLYGFKLIVEHLTHNVIMQTIKCETNVSEHPWVFTREYSHNGTSYVWTPWVLVTNNKYYITTDMENGYTISNKIAYMKDNRVLINFEITKSSGNFSGTMTKVATVNPRVKPSHYVQTVGYTNNGELALIQVTTDGYLRLSTKDASANKIRGVVEYDVV